MKSDAIRVVINTPAKSGLFDYSVPAELAGKIRPGQMVIVPFNHRIYQGVVWQTGVTAEVKRLLPIRDLSDPLPVLTEAQLKLAEKIAERSLAPVHECVNLLLTDKIRRISDPVYHLLKTDIPFQAGFSGAAGGSGSKDAVFSLFAEKGETLTEKDLDQALGKNVWKAAMDALVESGVVQKSFRIDNTGPGPKLRITAALCPGLPAIEGMNFSKSPAADQRRRAALLYLEQHGREVFQTELLSETGVKREDLAYLEKRGWITLQTRDAWRNHQHYMQETPDVPAKLTEEQEAVCEHILSGLHASETPPPVLLHGVTGSGKTEVYLQAAAEAIRMGRQVLVLVPEIALTPQILARFERRFPGQTGVYHSALGEGERFDTWRRGRSGEFRVIVGPRSALAVPLPDLGLILVDECHEDAYYQTNERPFFSAVRAAADLAEITGSQLVLGSATPTTAQMFKAQRSGWQIETLRKRATGVRPPRVMLADMRAELKTGNSEIFSRTLIREIGRTLEMGKQSILFLNRRGTASYTFCHNCGEALKCPNCDIPYTWHASRGRLECHYCGSSMKLPETCPTCGSTEIRQFGAGVELVEELITKQFPDAKVIRLDADTAEGIGSHEKLLSRFARHEADILVGTQMVARGLDFPDVRLVGILLADVGANFHDYRVDEHSFQMLTQVAGRAGRAAEQGLAILQTFQPERYSIRAAVTGDYERFYENDLAYRRMLGYPPFSRMLRLEVRDPDPEKAQRRIGELAAMLKNRIREQGLKVRLIGPAPCFFPRLSGKYRWHVILRGADPVSLIRPLDLSGIRVEVDPPSLL
ncbi:MAG: primosomal protein N' [Flexilinea sp.]|nr:primosomal protein N' [Flexilinea sp.]